MVPKKIKNTLLLKRMLVEYISNPTKRYDKGMYSKFARKVGVPQWRVVAWAHSEDVSEMVRKRIHELIPSGANLARLYRKIYHQALAGSFKHQRLILEIAGEYTPGMRLEHAIETPEARFDRLEKQRQRAIQSISVPYRAKPERPTRDFQEAIPIPEVLR